MLYQGRMLMRAGSPLGRVSGILQHLATRYSKSVPQLEPMTSAKLVCLILGVVSLFAIGLLTLAS